jgi:polysaccharide deacetylase family protein (PEP-CTERM system associated)
VLGWVAERHPELVRQIVAAGHELASHGYAHQLVYNLTPDEFRADVRRAKAILEDISGQAVLGYRAPSFSITRQSSWAFAVLASEGYQYDASVFPIHHDRYGIPDAPRHPYMAVYEHGTMAEFPASTFRLAGQNFPIGGGGYFRMLPYEWTRQGIRHVNRREGKAVMFYLHPWEIDPAQPRIKTSLVSTLRHYTNLGRTEARLRRLLSDFSFGPAISVLSSSGLASTSVPPAEAVPLSA